MSIACFKIRKWRATFINQICVDGCDWFKVCLKEQLWLVDSQCDIVGIRLKFSHVNWCEKFQAWIWCEIFHTWNRCEFSIRHVQPCSTCGISNLHTFQTCFWCESGMKQAWSYESILYGKFRLVLFICCLTSHYTIFSVINVTTHRCSGGFKKKIRSLTYSRAPTP